MDESLELLKKRQWVFFIVNDCFKDEFVVVMFIVFVDVIGEYREEKFRKCFRLYFKCRRKQRKVNCLKVDDEVFCVIFCINGEVLIGNEVDGRNL